MWNNQWLLTAIFISYFVVADDSDDALKIFYVLPSGEVILPEEDLNYTDPLSIMRLQKIQNQLQLQSLPSQAATKSSVNASEKKEIPASTKPKRRLILLGSEVVEIKPLQPIPKWTTAQRQQFGIPQDVSTSSTVKQESQSAEQTSKDRNKDKTEKHYIIEAIPHQGMTQQGQSNLYRKTTVPATKEEEEPQAIEKMPEDETEKQGDFIDEDEVNSRQLLESLLNYMNL